MSVEHCNYLLYNSYTAFFHSKEGYKKCTKVRNHIIIKTLNYEVNCIILVVNKFEL